MKKDPDCSKLSRRGFVILHKNKANDLCNILWKNLQKGVDFYGNAWYNVITG